MPVHHEYLVSDDEESRTPSRARCTLENIDLPQPLTGEVVQAIQLAGESRGVDATTVDGEIDGALGFRQWALPLPLPRGAIDGYEIPREGEDE